MTGLQITFKKGISGVQLETNNKPKTVVKRLTTHPAKPRNVFTLNSLAVKKTTEIVETSRSVRKKTSSSKIKQLNGTLSAGDLCYVRSTIWNIEDGQPVLSKYYTVVRVVSITTTSHNTLETNIHFQLVSCPSTLQEAVDMVKCGTVLKSPYITASCIVKFGKIGQQPHTGGMGSIYKINESLLSPDQVYFSDPSKDRKISELLHISSRLDLVGSNSGSHMFVSEEKHAFQSRIRVVADSGKFDKSQKVLEYMSQTPLSMLLWGTTKVSEMYSGCEGYVKTSTQLPLPCGWAYGGSKKEGDTSSAFLTTPTGRLALHLCKNEVVRNIVKFTNGFRIIGNLGEVWVPVQINETEKIKATAHEDSEAHVYYPYPSLMTYDYESADENDDDDNDDMNE